MCTCSFMQLSNQTFSLPHMPTIHYIKSCRYRTRTSVNIHVNCPSLMFLTHTHSNKGNYVKLLFLDYSSVFNTIVPHRLAFKLRTLGFNSLCYWVLKYLGKAEFIQKHTMSSISACCWWESSVRFDQSDRQWQLKWPRCTAAVSRKASSWNVETLL